VLYMWRARRRHPPLRRRGRVHALAAEPGRRWPECRDQPPFPHHRREL